MSMSWWAMGGYAAYVWPAYGVSALGIGAAVAWTLGGWRRVKRELAALEAMDAQ